MAKNITTKNYQAVGNPLIKAIENCPKAVYSQFYAEIKVENLSAFRRYKERDFKLWRCEGWFIDLCVEYLNMSYADFKKPVKDIDFSNKLRLFKN